MLLSVPQNSAFCVKNSRVSHSSIGFKTPVSFEGQHNAVASFCCTAVRGSRLVSASRHCNTDPHSHYRCSFFELRQWRELRQIENCIIVPLYAPRSYNRLHRNKSFRRNCFS
jgi:hypothetical protein